MPWITPTLRQWRQQSRDYVVSQLPTGGVLLPNSPLRVMADNSASLSYQQMLYLNWLALQFLPDTAEDAWLNRFAAIWLPNNGRKAASYASGSISVTGVAGVILPAGSIYSAPTSAGTVQLQTTAAVTVSAQATPVAVVSLAAGAISNLDAGALVSLTAGPPGGGVDGTGTVIALGGGADAETDAQLRARVLNRIQQPPMGGDGNDYVQWAEIVPGVTRAWCSPLEMGVGTVTVRFMMDSLRAANGGFPTPVDVAEVQSYINTRRPVTAIDAFVVAPVPEPINFTLSSLNNKSASTLQNIEASVSAMLLALGAPAFSLNGVSQPAQTIYAAWINDAVYQATGVKYFDLGMSDHAMPGNGSIATLGNIILG